MVYTLCMVFNLYMLYTFGIVYIHHTRLIYPIKCLCTLYLLFTLNIVYLYYLKKRTSIIKLLHSKNIRFLIKKCTSLPISCIYSIRCIYFIQGPYTTYKVYMIYNGTIRAAQWFASLSY